MKNQKTITKEGINYLDWRIILISLIFIGTIFYTASLIITELLNWQQIPPITRILIALMIATFLYDRIIGKASELLIKIFQGLSLKKGLTEIADTIIEEDKEQQQKEIKEMEQKMLNS